MVPVAKRDERSASGGCVGDGKETITVNEEGTTRPEGPNRPPCTRGNLENEGGDPALETAPLTLRSAVTVALELGLVELSKVPRGSGK